MFYYYLITDYFQGQTLDSYVLTNEVNEEHAQIILKGLISLVIFCNEHKISLLGYLTAENIIVDNYYEGAEKETEFMIRVFDVGINKELTIKPHDYKKALYSG